MSSTILFGYPLIDWLFGVLGLVVMFLMVVLRDHELEHKRLRKEINILAGRVHYLEGKHAALEGTVHLPQIEKELRETLHDIREGK